MSSTDLFFARQHTVLIDTFWLQAIPAEYIQRDLLRAGSITDLYGRAYTVQAFHKATRPKRKQFWPAVFSQRAKLKAAISDSHGIQKLRALQTDEHEMVGPTVSTII